MNRNPPFQKMQQRRSRSSAIAGVKGYQSDMV